MISLTFDGDTGQVIQHAPPPELAMSQKTAETPTLPPPPPDIPRIITALINSPSIDQPTKNALIAALKGQ